MELFMPSEIARLVLGYLKETGCTNTVQIYLKENPHLTEYVTCLKNGVEYPTTIGGRSLTDLLQELPHLKTTAKNNQSSSEIKGLLDRLERGIAQLRYFTTGGCLQTAETVVTPLSSVRSVNPCKATSSGWNTPLRHEDDSFVGGCGAAAKCPVDIAAEIRSTPVVCDSRVGPARSQEGSPINQAAARSEALPRTIQEARGNARSYGVSVIKDFRSLVSSASDDSMLTTAVCSSNCCPSTPISKPPELFSSPASIARSALIFSFGVDALQTPHKERYLAEDGTWRSPRRKSHLPRKRLTFTPTSSKKKNCASVVIEESSEIVCEDSVDVSELIGQLLNNTALHERIAANINRVVSTSGQPEGAGCSGRGHPVERAAPAPPTATSERPPPPPLSPRVPSPAATAAAVVAPPAKPHMPPDDIIKDIVDRTESDPLFEAFLSIFFDKNDCNSHDSQPSVGSDEGVPSPDTHGTPNSQSAHGSVPATPCGVTENLVKASPCQIAAPGGLFASEVLTAATAGHAASDGQGGGEGGLPKVPGAERTFVTDSAAPCSIRDASSHSVPDISNSESVLQSHANLCYTLAPSAGSPSRLDVGGGGAVPVVYSGPQPTVTYTVIEPQDATSTFEASVPLPMFENVTEIVVQPETQTSVQALISDPLSQALHSCNVQFLTLSPSKLLSLNWGQVVSTQLLQSDSCVPSVGLPSHPVPISSVPDKASLLQVIDRLQGKKHPSLRPVRQQQQQQKSRKSCSSLPAPPHSCTDGPKRDALGRRRSSSRAEICAVPLVFTEPNSRIKVSVLNPSSVVKEGAEDCGGASVSSTVTDGTRTAAAATTTQSSPSPAADRVLENPASAVHGCASSHSPRLTRLLNSAKAIQCPDSGRTQQNYVRVLNFDSSPAKLPSPDTVAKRDLDRSTKTASGDREGVSPLVFKATGDGFYSSKTLRDAPPEKKGVAAKKDSRVPAAPVIKRLKPADGNNRMGERGASTNTGSARLRKRLSKSLSQDLHVHKKRTRTESTESALSDMDVEQFLSKLKYME